MPISMSIDHARRQVVARVSGPVTLADISSHLESERAEGGLPFGELMDGRGSQPDISPAEIREIVGILRQYGSTTRLGPTAIIVGTDLEYGMIRMLEMLAEDLCEIRPFREQEEAESWLATVDRAWRPSI